MESTLNRRTFIKSLALSGAGVSLVGSRVLTDVNPTKEPVAVGIIGLDTSHSPAFTRLINFPDEQSLKSSEFQVVAAYPYGSRTIESSYSRIPRYTEEVQEMGVEIADSIDELLARVDVVLLETNDGHPRLEQALQVLQAGKPMFIDKPIAGSLQDTVAILDAATKYKIPVFSSSPRRYIREAQAVRNENKIGKVMGADTYSPATIEASHPDLFWYGIHGVEILFTVMGTGCKSVTRFKTDETDIAVGIWEDDRLGTFRGIRAGRSDSGGTAFGTDQILSLDTYEGYGPLIKDVLGFFRTGTPPVEIDETLEIYAFMEAADESERRGGEEVTLEEVLSMV